MSDDSNLKAVAIPARDRKASMPVIAPDSYDGAWRFAVMISRSGMAPKGMQEPEKIMPALLHGMELGLTPMASIQSIAIVNGRPALWGDAALALVRGSQLLEDFDELVEGQGDARVGVCVAKRRGQKTPIRRTFSVADAKSAGLWGKSGPWTQYPDRMLQLRARGFCLRDGFSDVLSGIHIGEEQQDISEGGDGLVVDPVAVASAAAVAPPVENPPVRRRRTKANAQPYAERPKAVREELFDPVDEAEDAIECDAVTEFAESLSDLSEAGAIWDHLQTAQTEHPQHAQALEAAALQAIADLDATLEEPAQ